MLRLNASLVALSALLAVGAVSADGLGARTQDSAAAAIAARFPAQDQMFAACTPAPAPAGAAEDAQAPAKIFSPAGDCVREHWPYIADECLAADEGVPVKPVRTITIKRPATKAPKAKPAAAVQLAATAAAIR